MCRWNYLPLFLILISISECLGGNDKEDDEGRWNWSAAAGLGVIIGITCFCAALFSLLAWVTCSIYTKCRKDRVGHQFLMKNTTGGPAPPPWSLHLMFNPELAVGFGAVSDGFVRVGASHLVRSRTGTSYTDGAKWAAGMANGKHVFEITWPWGHRGYHAAVGLATGDAPIHCKGLMPLVGSNPKTWGLDIVKRKALHRNKPILTCPTDGSYIPDKFFMYVDLEKGDLGFGNGVTYWGEVITGLPCQGTQPLYLMVGASQWQSEISVVYIGSAVDGGYPTTNGGIYPQLPPVYQVSPNAPPTYMDTTNGVYNPAYMDTTTNDTSNSIMEQPSLPVHGVMNDPPPPYSRPPQGFARNDF